MTTLTPLHDSRRQLTPEQQLQFAVLEDALRVIQHQGRQWKRPAGRRRYLAETLEWLHLDADPHADPYSAAAVCESLGLSLAALRLSVAEAVGQPGWIVDGTRRGARRMAR